LEQAMSFANACGAIVASKSGVLNALPKAETVATFLESATVVEA
jgi:sugar/nucleoside kinase (ribokinase family)